MTPESTGQQDMRTYLRVLWRWKLLFLAFLVLIPLAAYFLERGKPKIYQASTLIAPSLVTSSYAVNFNLSAVAQLVTTSAVATAAAASIHPSASAGSLVGEVSASANTATNFLSITAVDHDPNRAAAIANAFAAALSKYLTTQTVQGIDGQIGALAKQLAGLPRSDVVARAPLSLQIAQLRGLRGAPGNGARVIQPAVASATPVGPNTRRAVEIAFVIALLLGIGAIVLAENSDLRLRTPEALENLTNMPLLGVIPPSAFSPDPTDRPRDDEAFQMLRAALTYFNVDRPVASVAIISPGPAEGKTTVAVGLAIAAARAGKRVILVDADLRRPMVAGRLGIASAVGLSDVLAKERPLSEVLVEHELDPPAQGRLMVLPAGPAPADPHALLGSEALRMLLAQLEGWADLVIVDTAALLAVGDALPLLRAVSGVAMIVRMDRSSRASVRRMQKLIESAGGTVTGVVATASRAVGGGYGSAYGYYAHAQSGRRRRWRRRRGRVPTGTPTGSSRTAAAVLAATPTTETRPAGQTGLAPEPRALARQATATRDSGRGGTVGRE